VAVTEAAIGVEAAVELGLAHHKVSLGVERPVEDGGPDDRGVALHLATCHDTGTGDMMVIAGAAGSFNEVEGGELTWYSRSWMRLPVFTTSSMTSTSWWTSLRFVLETL
jgi:hypothetical protein